MTIGLSAMSLPIADIGELDADAYVGLIDEAAVSCLVARLALECLKTPIWVRRNGNKAPFPYSVVAGRHRLRAARALGWETILAEEKAGPKSTIEDLRALQLVENLDRRTLRPIEQALNIVERWRQAASLLPNHEATNQQGRAIMERWAEFAAVANTPAPAKSAIDEACANACGISVRKVQMYRRIFETIVVPFPDHFALLNAHPLGESLSAMTQLASLKLDSRHQQRRAAIDKMLERDDWQNMSAVFEAAGLKESNGNRIHPDNHSAVMTAAWSKMRLNEKRQYLEHFPKILNKTMAKDLVVRLMREFEI